MEENLIAEFPRILRVQMPEKKLPTAFFVIVFEQKSHVKQREQKYLLGDLRCGI